MCLVFHITVLLHQIWYSSTVLMYLAADSVGFYWAQYWEAQYVDSGSTYFSGCHYHPLPPPNVLSPSLPLWEGAQYVPLIKFLSKAL